MFTTRITYAEVSITETKVAVRRGLTSHMRKRGLRAKQVAKRMAGKKTGALKASITLDMRMRYGAAVARVGSSLPYAMLHHTGTRPHIIVPRRKPLLVFKIGRRTIRTKLVKHPGTAPNNYLRVALEVAARTPV
jgi:phage gpG-like protein